MLPKIHRLRADKDFKNIFKNGELSENQFFRIKFLKNQKKFSRFGFIISTKIAKKSTLRNLLKRRLRAAVRFFLKDIKISFDIAVWPKTNSISASYKDLFESLKNLLTKNGILSL